jgi:hypothetical protein
MAICSRVVVVAILGALLWAASTAGAAGTATVACPAGSKRAVIGGKVKCLRAGQACSARYQAAYRKHGFTCVGGHLRKRATAPPPTPEPPAPPPPPPPPPPPAQPGHYQGQTSQLEVFSFDVTSSGTSVTNIVTGQINEGCTPPGHLYGGNYKSGSGLIPISADGSFKLDFNYTGSVGSSPSTGRFTITGHFSGATATGTLSDSTNFTYNGVAYACGSGLQTWNVSRTG